MFHRIAGTEARLPLQSPDLDATEAMHPLAVLFGFATQIADFFVEKPESFRNMLPGNKEQLASKMLQRQNFQPILATAHQHQSSLLASSPAGWKQGSKTQGQVYAVHVTSVSGAIEPSRFQPAPLFQGSKPEHSTTV